MKKKFKYEGRDLEAMSFAEKYHQWILDEFQPYLGRTIVEVGAGSGSFTEMLAGVKPSPKKVIGIEPSDEMYPLLKKSLKNVNKKIETQTYQAFFADVAPKIQKQKPSSIVYINVFEHIKHDTVELDTLFETLPKGGRVCIFVPANPSLMSKFDRKIGHFRRYTKSDLTNKVKNAGFKVVRVKRFDGIGILPWLIKFRLGGSEDMQPGLTKLYDNMVVPIESRLEKLITPLVGKNLLLVAKKP